MNNNFELSQDKLNHIDEYIDTLRDDLPGGLIELIKKDLINDIINKTILMNSGFYCKYCNSGMNNHQNHLSSKRHLYNLKKYNKMNNY